MLKYDDLMKSEDIDYERNTKTPDETSSNDESGIYLRDSTSGVDRINDDIQVSFLGELIFLYSFFQTPI